MSCGEPHETDCSEVLDHLYEYLDREMPDSDCEKFKEHFDECSPCLEKYGLEQEVKKLVKRCCGHDDVPSDLRSKVMGRIELIRAAEAAGAEVPGGQAESEAGGESPQAPPPSESVTGRKKYA
ncbi:anti-sigma factor [Streptomyces abyssalis]|uniref:Anti-sigma factor n=1 Tax=Streptomyces abyssalis TaxID=933944 RepID=A0A1E7JGG1_9ACTN|nr:mycothiol system anti-sigma-R factor [Streptomyces abyssalis]OEU85540.1 anti-sigma factor [Streptomyces abyssalis]OEU92996.1 anti-sigma factor [Streptomyces abyssalis]OEV30792.1 anti-sigma factor [Streptomyces nanshensis]